MLVIAIVGEKVKTNISEVDFGNSTNLLCISNIFGYLNRFNVYNLMMKMLVSNSVQNIVWKIKLIFI